MGKPIKNTEPYHQYILDNYKHQSLAAMASNLNIDVRIVKKGLSKLGIIRSPELIASFRGHKNICPIRDAYFKENYLTKPLRHICKDQGISDKMGELILKRLGLVRPPELVLMFKSLHTSVTEKQRKSSIKNKPVLKNKKEPKRKLKFNVIKPVEPVLPTRQVDYSNKIMVKIDHRTWVYRDKTA